MPNYSNRLLHLAGCATNGLILPVRRVTINNNGGGGKRRSGGKNAANTSEDTPLIEQTELLSNDTTGALTKNQTLTVTESRAR